MVASRSPSNAGTSSGRDLTISVMLLLLLLLVLSSLDIIILDECQALLLSSSNYYLRGRLPRSSHIPTNRRRILLNSTATAEKATSTTKNQINPITETHEEGSNNNISSSSSSSSEIHDHPETTIETTTLGEEVGHAFYQKLLELDTYIQLYGHCRVPKRYAPNPSLGNWVNKQRQQYKKYMAIGGCKGGGDHSSDVKTSMNETRIKALNQRNFIWDATTTTTPSPESSSSSTTTSAYDDTSWQRMYNQLEQYYTIHKHCNVPSTTSLGQWAVRQRFHYRRKQLTNNECRIQMLNKLNFTWPTYSEQVWELRIQQLREFASIYGHVCVPRSYTANPSLGPWVATQRKYYNIYLSQQQQRQEQQQQQQHHGSGVLAGERVGGGLDSSKKIRMTSRCPLTKERINQLDEMGFVWSYWDYNFNKKVNQKQQ